MKNLNAIVKIVTALAAVAGAIYVVATYGEKIVAWCKKVLASLPKCPCCEQTKVIFSTEDKAEEPVAEVPVEDAAPAEEPAEEPAEPEEEPVEEIPLTPAPNEPVAEDHDFAE